MSEPQNAIISSGDYFILQSLVVPPGKERDLLADLVRRKLGQSIVTFPADIGPDIVGLGSRVLYRIDGLRTEERTLVEQHQPGARCLPLLSVHGLALLGLSVGQSAIVHLNDRVQQVLAVEAVSRPELAGNTQTIASRDPRVLRFRPKAVMPARSPAFIGDEDDPGPGAA
jgi:hypothetical protein